MGPLTIRRKQNHKVMTPASGEHSALGSGGEGIFMIRALGKAFYWHKLLDRGEFATIRDLSRSMRVEQGWLTSVCGIDCARSRCLARHSHERSGNTAGSLYRVCGASLAPQPNRHQAKRSFFIESTHLIGFIPIKCVDYEYVYRKTIS